MYRAVSVVDSSRTYFVSGRDVLIMNDREGTTLQWWVGFAPERADFTRKAVQQASEKVPKQGLVNGQHIDDHVEEAVTGAFATDLALPSHGVRSHGRNFDDEDAPAACPAQVLTGVVSVKSGTARDRSGVRMGSRISHRIALDNGTSSSRIGSHKAQNLSQQQQEQQQEQKQEPEHEQQQMVRRRWRRMQSQGQVNGNGEEAVQQQGNTNHDNGLCTSSLIRHQERLNPLVMSHLVEDTESLSSSSQIVRSSGLNPRLHVERSSGASSTNATANGTSNSASHDSASVRKDVPSLDKVAVSPTNFFLRNPNAPGCRSGHAVCFSPITRSIYMFGGRLVHTSRQPFGGVHRSSRTMFKSMVDEHKALVKAWNGRPHGDASAENQVPYFEYAGVAPPDILSGTGSASASDKPPRASKLAPRKPLEHGTAVKPSPSIHRELLTPRIPCPQNTERAIRYHVPQNIGVVQGELLAYPISRGVWHEVITTGTPPPPLFGHAMVSVQGRFYLFGGCTAVHSLSSAENTRPTSSRTSKPRGDSSYVRKVPEQETSTADPNMCAPDRVSLPDMSRGVPPEQTSSGELNSGGDTSDGDGALDCMKRCLDSSSDMSRLCNDMYCFDVETRVWRMVDTPLKPPPMMHHTMSRSGERLFVIGGITAHSCSGKVYMFDTRSEKWTLVNAGNNGPSPRGGHSATSVGEDIFVFGGFDGQFFFSDTFVFNVGKMLWDREPRGKHVPLARAFHCTVSSGAHLLLVGGKTALQTVPDIHTLDLVVGNYVSRLKQRHQRKVSMYPYDWQLNEFEFLRTVGTGSFSRVHLCRHRETNQYFVMKIVNKACVVRNRHVQHMRNEIGLLKELRHQSVVELINVFQDDTCVFMLMEFVSGGEFFALLNKVGRFSEDAARFFAANIVLVFEHLHAIGVVYRDLKPENVLVDAHGYLKLTNFGFAKRIDARTFTLCGTAEYMAPEVLLNKGHGFAVDWWSLGIFIYEMIVGEPPFMANSPIDVYKQILRNEIAWKAPLDTSMPVAKNIIESFLMQDVTLRLGSRADEVKQHPWFDGVNWERLHIREAPAPLKPRLCDPGDSENFEVYPESLGGLGEVLNEPLDMLLHDF